jgi:hypothetical protein
MNQCKIENWMGPVETKTQTKTKCLTHEFQDKKDDNQTTTFDVGKDLNETATSPAPQLITVMGKGEVSSSYIALTTIK